MLMIAIYFNIDTLSQNWIVRWECALQTTRYKMKRREREIEKKWNILNKK